MFLHFENNRGIENNILTVVSYTKHAIINDQRFQMIYS